MLRSEVLSESHPKVFVLGFPIQFVLVQIMFKARLASVVVTDKRVRLTTEVLSGIRLIKLYAWETFYGHQIMELRRKEIAKIREMAYVSLFNSLFQFC
jgi:ATP-binding cassette, subfamily C (CFTR/MRP), member 1